MTSHTIPNILNFVDQIQAEIELPAIHRARRTAPVWQALEDRLARQIHTAVEEIEAALQSKALTAGDLAIRSRRAYQWLRFLADSPGLNDHLNALLRVDHFLPDIQGASRAKKNLQVSFYHQGALYRLRERGRDLEIKIQESYITAPDSILKSLLVLCFQPDLKTKRREIKDYTFSRAYKDLRGTLEYLGVPRGSFAAGSVHDLRESFQRVNQEYFNGSLDQPKLIWNNRLTHRKFGHYQWDTDTVMLSSSLDHPRVPRLAVDYVMYHELLHKKMGAKKANHNRIAHTADFRKAESQYRELARAKRVLQRIARSR